MARGLHAGADGAAVTSTARHGVRNGTLAALVGAVLALGACGGRELGDACGGPDDCGSALQCLNHRCTARCERAPDCGDGYACDDQGLCHPATGSLGDRCASEVDCASGLSCQINGAALDASNRLLSSCTAVNHEDDDLGTHTRAAGAACGHNGDCYNGTCALGHCVDLCRTDRDCAAAQSCVVIPSELATNAVFSGCLPSRGAITWTIPVSRPAAEILLPVPGGAQFAELVMTVGDQNQKVGAASVLSPRGERQYTLPCSPQLSAACGPELAVDQFFANPLRHQPGLGESVLTIPSGPASVIGPGMYRVKVSSFQPDGTPGTALPRVTAVVKLDAGAALDLHFFFLDLSAHPCLPAGEPLSAASAPRLPYFQTEFLDRLRALLNDSAGITLGPSTYEDVIRLDSTSVSALNNVALIYAAKRDPARAEATFRRVVGLPNTYSGAFFNLVHSQVMNRRPAATIDTSRRVLSNSSWRGMTTSCRRRCRSTIEPVYVRDE